MWLDELRLRSNRSPYRPVLRTCIREAVAFEISQIERYVFSQLNEGRYELPPSSAPLAPYHYLEWAAPSLPGGRAALLAPSWLRDNDEPGWIVGAFPITRTPDDDGFMISALGLLTLINADGSIVGSRFAKAVEGEEYIEYATADDYAAVREDVLMHMRIQAYLALTAFCFAHCKGVTITDHQQPRQQRRAAERAGKPPLVTYKTIDIAPVTRLLRDEGDIEHNGLQRALHITRGHFAHYTPDKPLFGKYTGTYYRPMHVRGALDRGMVVKDYRVTDKAAKAGL